MRRRRTWSLKRGASWIRRAKRFATGIGHGRKILRRRRMCCRGSWRRVFKLREGRRKDPEIWRSCGHVAQQCCAPTRKTAPASEGGRYKTQVENIRGELKNESV